LLENQDRISLKLLESGLPTTRLNGYSVPADIAEFVSCWGDSDVDRQDDLSRIYYRCQSEDDIFLSNSLSTGIIRYQHDLIATENLHPLRFYHQLERRGHFPQVRLEGDEDSVTNYSCQSKFVDQAGLPLKVTFCIRRYRLFDGLYDAYLQATSLVESREALQSTLGLGGFSWRNVSLLSTRFLEGLSWKE
jgi:hypothetical protein